MNELIRQKTGINIQTHTWLTKEEVACPGFICKILYYWTGLLNNEIHKFKYLTLKAKLGILKTQIIAMVSDLYAEVMTSMQIPRTEEEMKEFKSQSQYRGNEIERVDENRSDSPVPSWKFDYDEKASLTNKESIIIKVYNLKKK